MKFYVWYPKIVECNDDERDKRVYSLNVNIKNKGGSFMLNQKVADLLNQQINKEFYSAYLYLDFSNYYEVTGLDDFANWYKVLAQEERDHAMLFYQYLQNNNCPVTLEAIEKPNVKLENTMDALKAGLTHEEYVTSLINAICAATHEVNELPYFTIPELVY